MRISLPSEDNLELFTEDIYYEFKRYLQPPFHVLSQGIEIIYSDQQKNLIENTDKRQKIKGVAGSGKTIILAKKAVDAHKRHHKRVLILTYNVTLRNYIRDHISDVRENFSWGAFYIDNYHDFFKQNTNNLGINITVSHETRAKNGIINNEQLSKYLEKKIYSNIYFFEKYFEKTLKYNSILIDEIQDYKPEWIKIIRKYFLTPDGEIILFGDEKQNIYNLKLDSDKKIKTVQGFGSWKNLTKPKRQLGGGDRILELSKKFQQAFFRGKYELDSYENQINQIRANEGIYTTVVCKSLNDRMPVAAFEPITYTIFQEIESNKIHPNDVVIIAPKIAIVRKIDFHLRNIFNVNTITTFESDEMYELFHKNNFDEIKNIRKNKKLSFNANSGKLKLSTIHSFKGYEAQSVFLILGNEEFLMKSGGDYDSKYHEIIYAGITRSKSNLMVFVEQNDRFHEFFTIALGEYKSIQKDKAILEVINDSINHKIFIDIKYKQHDVLVEYKSIKPYKVLFMNDNYYVACEVNNKYKFSMFRLSNIKNITSTDKSFDLNIDIQDFIANIQTPFSRYRENYRDHLIDVIVEVDKSKAHFFENKQFLASQSIHERKKNGNLLLLYKVTQEQEIEELIKRWIPYMKVIEPFTLDEKIRSDLKKYLNN